MDESRKSIDFGWLRVGVGGDVDVVVALPEGDGVVPERPGEIEPAQFCSVDVSLPLQSC